MLLLFSPTNFLINLLEQPECRSLRIKSFIFVVWEQVLDASAKATIQHAATKITNINDLILRLLHSGCSSKLMRKFVGENRSNIPIKKTKILRN